MRFKITPIVLAVILIGLASPASLPSTAVGAHLVNSSDANQTSFSLASMEYQKHKGEYAPGELIVKFGPEVGGDVYSLKTSFGISQMIINIPSLRKLHEDWGVKDYGRVFKSLESKMMKENLSEQEVIQNIQKKFYCRTARAPETLPELNLSNIYLLKLPENADIFAAAKEYEQNPYVDYAHPNYICRVASVPNDPYYSSYGTWGQDYDDMWGLKIIQAENAWNEFENENAIGADVVVAVVDTGADYNHEDLAANIWINPAEIAGNGIDDDNNGYIDDVRGWDFAYNDNDPMDGAGHGTHVSGTIAAVTNNGIGVAGVSWHSKIMIVKGLSDEGEGDNPKLADAIYYAVANGADVISNSWGPIFPIPENPVIEAAVNFAHAAGVVVVFSAGNNNYNVMYYSPANSENVITVSAFDHNDKKTDFSNWGERIDVAAPGGDSEIDDGDNLWGRNILSLRAAGTDMYTFDPHYVPGTCIVGERYYRMRGTSMAAPHVSGVAALLLSLNPELSNEDVRDVLRFSADDVDAPGWDINSGHGRINAYNAVRMYNSGIQGYVTDATTLDAIPCAKVTIQETGHWKYTFENGYYKIYALPGNYTLVVNAFGYYDNTAIVNVIENQWVTENIVLAPLPTGFITGQVTDNALNPIENATIALLETPLKASTDIGGNYTIEAPVGLYDIRASAIGYYSACKYDVEVVEDQVITENFELMLIKPAPLADTPWPKFMNDLLNTGQSLYLGAQENEFRWQGDIDSTLFAPTIGPDGTIYAGGFWGDLWAVNPDDGTVKWTYSTGQAIWGSPAVNSDGIIFFGTAVGIGKLYALTPEGELLWAFTGNGWPIASSPTIGQDGTIYFGAYSGMGIYPIGGRFYALKPEDGTEKWSYQSTTGPIGYLSSPAIGPDDTIYFTTHGYSAAGQFVRGGLCALDENGVEKWSFPVFQDYEAVIFSPAIGPDGTIYFGTERGIYAVYDNSDNGTLKWFYPCVVNNASLAIGSDGTIYALADGQLYALNPDNTLKWSYDPPGSVSDRSLAIGSDGTIYITTRSPNCVYAISSAGEYKWSYFLDVDPRGLAINSDGTTYVTTSDDLYAIGPAYEIKFSLDTLYKISLNVDNLWIENGRKFVLKFYTYTDAYQGENVVWSGTTLEKVSFSKIVPHPEGKAVKKARLDLTTDDTENVISTIASYTVRKVDLEIRFTKIPGEWFLAPPEKRITLELEFSAIPGAWFLAPSSVGPLGLGSPISEPGGTTIEVMQGDNFLIRHTLEWDEPENGAYTVTMGWDCYDDHENENFTFLGAEAYFDLDNDNLPDPGLDPILAVVTLDSAPSWDYPGSTRYALRVSCPADNKDNRDGQFNVDITLRAAGVGGIPHIPGDHVIPFQFAGTAIIESTLQSWNRDPITIRVLPKLVLISPKRQSGAPGATLKYAVAITNVRDVADNFDLTVSDNSGWALTLSENRLENVLPGENRSVTLSVTIPDNALDSTDNITVTATSAANPEVKSRDTCAARAIEVKTAIFYPSDDTNAYERYPDSNYGSSTSIWVSPYDSQKNRGFLKFDLSGLPSGAWVTGAKLNLYCWNKQYDDFDAAAYEVANDNWSENTLTWNNQPSYGGRLYTVRITGVGWYTWEVRSFIDRELKGDEVASLCIKGAVEPHGGRARFDSKEYDNSDMHPYLEITYTSPSGEWTGEWTEKADTPDVGGYGEAVVGTGSYIYIAKTLYATSTPQFWRYDPTANSWANMSITGLPTGAFRSGTALAWDNSDYIYALAGARYSDSNRRLFFCYSISGDNWTQMADTPGPQGAGDAITWSGHDGYIYALMGSSVHGTTFARYNPASDNWEARASPPAGVEDGASLVWTGGDYLYALRGEYLETTPLQDFWRYDIVSDNWTAMTPIPENGGVSDGGSLLWVGNWLPAHADYIYALGGGDCWENPGDSFYRYIISANTWEKLTSIPYPIGYYVGNRLGFADGHIYYWQGTPSEFYGGGRKFWVFEFPA